MANTKSTTDKLERKKLKRAARKKAAPKGKRTGGTRREQGQSQEGFARQEQTLALQAELRGHGFHSHLQGVTAR